MKLGEFEAETMTLVIKNGFVYDPLNKIDGEVMDISLADGKIVESVNEGEAKVIDAKGMVVMPGGVDMHSHIAGAKVNLGRMLRPEDHQGDEEPKTSNTRCGVGSSVPSTFATGYRYARMGYTTVFEPATPPLKTRHTHEELDDTPMIDKGCYPLFGNNWFVMDYIAKGEINKCAAYISWMISSLKGYAIKLVNPGGVEAWHWGKNVRDLDDTVPHFGVTPRQIVKGLCRVNGILNMPHPIHVHPNNLGKPGNYLNTLKTMDCVRGLLDNGRPTIHLTHCQFTSYTGRDWMNLRSGAEEIADYVNRHSHVSIDTGQVAFGDTTTMTADGPFQFILYELSGNRWVNGDVENETGAGIVPYTYKRKNYVNATQWIIGLELSLLIKDPWRVVMTTDHPNAGKFTEYPRVIAWLMSRKSRRATLDRINGRARKRNALEDLDREYSLGEVATVTRAAPSRLLGLHAKGSLGVGCDADISIYNLDPRTDLSENYKAVRKAFRRAAYTIKGGEIVSRNGEILKSVFGQTHWVNSKISEDIKKSTISDIHERFEQSYTVSFNNYGIEEEYLRSSHPIEVKGGL